jgi:chromosome segregation ATPase
MYRMNSSNIKTPQIKNLRRHREDFNKHQSKTKQIIKKGIYEINKTTQDMIDKLNKDKENLRKMNQTEILKIKNPLNQIKNSVEGHSRRPEQVEDRLSELEDKIDIKEKKKTEECLEKRLKSCERNT